MNIISFVLNAVFLGIGLAMDAFSVSLANGLNEPKMKKNRICLIALTFGVFQALMPLIGWFCIHTLVEKFKKCEMFIPWIALILLLFIGGKMLIEGIRNKEDEENKKPALGKGALLIQGIATSIDALSVGFTIADFSFSMAMVEIAIIGIITFFICVGGLLLGKKFGTKLSNKASIFGGIILIVIGIDIFIKGVVL